MRPFPIAPGFVIGIAVAGFFDGVVLHQILQWHHMICIESHCLAATVATLKLQTFTDGIFHAAMWLVLVGGLVLLANAVARGERFARSRFWGALLLGAGAFNVVEGIVDHHLLQIHHVRFGPTQTVMDVGFLIVSAILAVAGWRIARRDVAAP
ncbi:MAG TPA: DUF2243 domain-containing protein [Thermoanaerobaculia bacterium]|jgi:uncharacterized membrane protein|nr:DUF2243 domain-containing protein [Thermoanaerobaculia bacterium]